MKMKPNNKIRWTDEMLLSEALKYQFRDQFQKGNNRAYQAARKRGKVFFNSIASHMPKRKDITGESNPHYKWTYQKLQSEANKYEKLKDFQDNSMVAYMTAWNRGILKEITSHMVPRNIMGANNPNYRWKNEELHTEALKYQTLVDFQKNSSAAYQSAWDRGLLLKLCSHMKPAHGSSVEEKQILAEIKKFFPNAKKMRTKRIVIADKPYIKMFELDIFIPELNKAIEYDGEYWHSYEVMRASKTKKLWSDEDIRNYHEIKDSYFLSQGIKILHIKEEDWIKDKSECISKIEKFLEIIGLISEYKKKVA